MVVVAAGSSIPTPHMPLKDWDHFTEDAGLGSPGAYSWCVHGTLFSVEIGASWACGTKQDTRFPQFILWLFVLPDSEPAEQRRIFPGQMMGDGASP